MSLELDLDPKLNLDQNLDLSLDLDLELALELICVDHQSVHCFAFGFNDVSLIGLDG